MPYTVPYAAAILFMKANRSGIQKMIGRQKERCHDTALSSERIEQLRTQAKSCLPVRLGELAARYGFSYNKVTIKHNLTNWGSCSRKDNINLNLHLMRLPAPLRDYVILHELCHLRHHDHGEAFHLLLEHLCTDNMLQLADEGDNDASRLNERAARSKARYPFDSVITAELRKYRLS